MGGGIRAEPAGPGAGQAGLGHHCLPPERPAALGRPPPLLLERPRHIICQVHRLDQSEVAIAILNTYIVQ
jgi:hypothetical protein